MLFGSSTSAYHAAPLTSAGGRDRNYELAEAGPARCQHAGMVWAMESHEDDARHPEAVHEPTPAVVSTFLLQGLEPPRLVVHHDDGTWTFTCGTTTEIEHLVTVHAEHMFRRFGYDLFHLRDLQPGQVAERDAPGGEWLTSPHRED